MTDAVMNPLVHPFSVYSILNGEKNKLLAGAGDYASAVALAAAVMIASQEQMSEVPLLYVFDETDQVVAFIGEL